MVFSSLTFLCVFLPAVLLLYMLSKNITYRNAVLTGASLVFYAWGEPSLLMLLLAATVVNYFFALGIDKYRGRGLSKLFITLTVMFDIGMIGVFKYAGFIVESINTVLPVDIPVPQISLPLGISFYTFQILTYVIDVYRNDSRVQKSYLKFLCFVCMFPQLIAGPIVRYSDVAAQLDDRQTKLSGFADGSTLFVLGLAKKVFLANLAGDAKDLLFAQSVTPTVASSWIGIIFYSFQLYFDFSAYSDMAIGMGKMLGFRFPQNFNYPYISRSITEFWRRWHMSLSSFFRDYVYIPLGGNRRHQMFNLLVVWMLTGLWHGASWNFVIWGLYYGILLIIEKLFFKNWAKVPVLSNITTLFLVVIGWGIFYFDNFGELTIFFGHLFGKDCGLYDATAISTLYANIGLLAACILFSTPLPYKLYNKLIAVKGIGFIIEGVVMVVLFVSCIAMLAGSTSNPFLYFRF